MSVIGEEIVRARRRRGQTQGDLAARVGVSQSHVSNIELGRSFDWKVILKLCETLELDHEALAAEHFGIHTRVEAEIRSDPTLRAEDRELLLTIYRALKERGPMAPPATEPGG